MPGPEKLLLATRKTVEYLSTILRAVTRWTGKGGPAVLSFASFVLSIMALKVNEQSMKVSQRAYVDVDNARVYAQPVVSFPGMDSARVITCTLTLRNTGNTPARFIELRAKTINPDGWTVATTDFSPQRPGPLGPKSERIWNFSEVIRLTPEAAVATINEDAKIKAYHEYRATHYVLPANIQPRPQVLIDFTLVYEDVFGARERLDWRASEIL